MRTGRGKWPGDAPLVFAAHGMDLSMWGLWKAMLPGTHYCCGSAMGIVCVTIAPACFPFEDTAGSGDGFGGMRYGSG